MQSKGNLRSMSGVITTVVALVILYFLAGILFYRVMDAIDVDSLSSQWLLLYNVLNSAFDLGLSIFIFMLVFCIITPLLWIFMNQNDGNNRM